jgi:hypothetical protein
MTALKVFSATKARDRAELGEKVTAWIKETKAQPLRWWVNQSSDNEFHCLSITIEYNDPRQRRKG